MAEKATIARPYARAAFGYAQRLVTLEPDDARLRRFEEMLKARVVKPRN